NQRSRSSSANDVTCYRLGLSFARIAGKRHRQRPAYRRTALLNDVGHLMCDQFVPVPGARVVLPGTEKDVAADGEGPSRHGSRERRGVVVDVNTHVPKWIAER